MQLEHDYFLALFRLLYLQLGILASFFSQTDSLLYSIDTLFLVAWS